MNRILSIIKEELAKQFPQTLDLYHGTCEDNANVLLQNGWIPRDCNSGGNCGNSRYLYLTTEPENAMWFANENGCSTILKLSNIPIEYIRPDPEDEAGFTMDDLLDRLVNSNYKLPANFILIKPLDSTYFKLI